MYGNNAFIQLLISATQSFTLPVKKSSAFWNMMQLSGNKQFSVYYTFVHRNRHSGILLLGSARDRDLLYRLNVVSTKKCDRVWIFPLLYADLFNRIDVACLTVPSILGLVL